MNQTPTAVQIAAFTEYRRLLKARKHAAALSAWKQAFVEALAHGWTRFQFLAWAAGR